MNATGITLPAALAAALLAVAGAASAQPAMKPGLWEIRMQNAEMDAAMKQMQAELAKMPPAQRAEMEKMMGGRGVMPAPAPGGGTVTRVCHSAETLRAEAAGKQEPGCETKSSWKGDTSRFESRCRDGRTMRGEFTFAGDGYQGFVEGTDPKRPGPPFRMEQTARWLGADCGKLAPAAAPKAR